MAVGKTGVAAIAIAGVIGLSTNASADPSDLDQVAAALKRLEARVAALETENKEVKADATAARAEARRLKQQLAERNPAQTILAARSASPGSPSASPGSSYAMSGKAPPPITQTSPNWTGFYAGASVGLELVQARTDQTTTDNIQSSLPVSIPNNFPRSTISATDQLIRTGLSGRGVGAMANGMLGYNYMISDLFLIGAEVDAGVSSARAKLTGISQTTATLTTAGLGSQTATAASTASDVLDSRWTASALGRAGVLIRPTDLLYALGGVTYGQFNAFGTSIGLIGGTAGVGLEHKIAQDWTIRGEYRGTLYATKRFNQSGGSSATVVGTNFFAGATGTQTETLSRTTSVSADSQSFLIAIAHQFGP